MTTHSVSLGTLLAVATTLAVGTAAAQESAPSEGLEEVMVTGTRIVRDGFQTPTPVTVLGGEALDAMAVTAIADAVNRLPMFSGGVSTRNSNTDINQGTAGINTLSLRGLGANRTLVLLDGKRVVGSSVTGYDHNTGAVNTNSIPTGLIERVEVVTGGASAVYGSDALAGVVNFILDTDYTGYKGSVQGGATTHGDGENFMASFTAGIPFAEDGRGHLLFNYEHAYQAAIKGLPRDWSETSYQRITNPDYTPSNGQPAILAVFQAGLSNATRGGLIVSCPSAPGTECPLRGTQFLEGGVPAPFEFGPIISGAVMSGGDWQLSRINRDMSLALELIRDTAFARTSYDLSDSTTAYVTLHWSLTKGDNPASAPNFSFGNINVLSGNPFIPASVQAEMTARGIPSFTMGSTNGDIPNFGAEGERTFKHYVVGAKGEFDAVDTDWLWDASYSRSSNDVISRSTSNRINPHFALALDAVLDDGQIVCRVNADADPANDDPACFPYNPMGIGVNSQSAIGYVAGTGLANTLLEQDVVAVNATGEPFSTWAGPVSLAFGAEHRREEVSGTVSALDEANVFLVGNYHPTRGKYNVTEGFLETVVPLANDKPFAELLNFNGAVRWTDYSTSGKVVTWKLGASWAPVEDVRFRLTRSRDIRAPSLGELFNGGLIGTGLIFDPFTNTTHLINSPVSGNPNLEPEEADTTGIGVVFTPSFLPGFAASVDYYDIAIDGAIATLDSDDYVEQCFEGGLELCSFIDFDANGAIEFVHIQPANVLSQSTSGVDVEMSYNFPLSSISSNWDGDLAFRALGTFVDSLETVDVKKGVTEGAGVNAGAGLYMPDLRYLLSATYDNHPFAATLSMRGIGSGVYRNDFLECIPGSCPPSTPELTTINNNHIDAVAYFDLTLSYRMFDDRAEVFFVAQNLLDEDPPLVAASRGSPYGPGNKYNYDRFGRMLSAGLRFDF